MPVIQHFALISMSNKKSLEWKVNSLNKYTLDKVKGLFIWFLLE